MKYPLIIDLVEMQIAENEYDIKLNFKHIKDKSMPAGFIYQCKAKIVKLRNNTTALQSELETLKQLQ